MKITGLDSTTATVVMRDTHGIPVAALLKDLCAFGQIKNITRRSNGFAFVRFFRSECAQALLKSADRHRELDAHAVRPRNKKIPELHRCPCCQTARGEYVCRSGANAHMGPCEACMPGYNHCPKCKDAPVVLMKIYWS